MKIFLRLLLCICLAASSSVQASPQEKLENLRQRITALQQHLEKTSESKSEAADALRESERAISTSKRKLADLAQHQHEANLNLGQLQQKKMHLEEGIQVQQAQLAKLLYQQYLGGRQEYLKLLLNNRDPDQVAREMQYYEYIVRSRATWINNLRTDLQQLNEITLQTRQQVEVVITLQAEEKIQKLSLEKDKLTRQQMLRQFSRQIKLQRHEIGRLRRDENRLSQLVAKLTEMLAQQGDKRIISNDQLPDNRFDGKLFAQLKGKLVLPVKGVVSNRFGHARPDSTVLWNGLQVRAAAGQAVKAVAAGRVVFADWLRGFGNLLILDHGQGYMSLYGNNETLYKQVGDTLRGGDTVAAVGNSGGNEDSGLYFELRHKGKPLDPLKWIALK